MAVGAHDQQQPRTRATRVGDEARVADTSAAFAPATDAGAAPVARSDDGRPEHGSVRLRCNPPTQAQAAADALDRLHRTAARRQNAFAQGADAEVVGPAAVRPRADPALSHPAEYGVHIVLRRTPCDGAA